MTGPAGSNEFFSFSLYRPQDGRERGRWGNTFSWLKGNEFFLSPETVPG